MCTTEFVIGQKVRATTSYMHSLTEGKEYEIVGYQPALVTPNFTFPAYATVIGDFGKPVTGHTYRFELIKE